MSRPRTKPYTEIGIRRVKCGMQGCNRKSYASWQICADGNQHRGLCHVHDIALNRMVLRWIGVPDAAVKLQRYERKAKARAGAA